MPSKAPTLDSLRTTLLAVGPSTPLDARFRALFTLKGLASSSSDAAEQVIRIIAEAFKDDSALLKHELAYVLGQMQDVRAIPTLEGVLGQESEHAMVRHEAAEALGAIGDTSSLPILQKYSSDADVSVRETCGLAIEKIEWASSEEGKAEALRKAKGQAGDSSFAPIDPAPALSSSASIQASKELLCNASAPLFQRYRAMFALRNAVADARKAAEAHGLTDERRKEERQKSHEAVLALAEGLSDGSALFRHEICFVFGELAHPSSVPSMLRVLSDSAEHEMVRHEAAEALGAVAEDAEEKDVESVLRELTRWAGDMQAPRVVRESCVVALDELKCECEEYKTERIEEPAAPVASAA